MYRLFIDNEEVEVNSKGLIQLSKMLIDLEDLSLRGINITNTLNLPFTQKNDRLTGYPSRLSSNNLAFESRKEYTLFDQSGIISRGNVIIKSFDDKKGIKIQLAEGSNFWNEAGSQLLDDLILHEDDFVFTTANMNALKVKSSSVFLTALHSATGSANDTALVSYDYTRPCYNFRVVLDKIVNQLGYVIDYTNTLELTDLLNIGCLSNAEKFLVSDYKVRFQNINQNGAIVYTGATSVFSKAGNVTQSGSNLTNATYKTSYVIKGFINAVRSSEITFNIDGNREIINIPAGRSLLNFRTDSIEVGKDVSINFSDLVTLEDVYIYSAIDENDIFKVDGSISVDNFLVLADYNLPEQTQKQFIKNLIKANFLDFTIDENNKVFSLRYLPDILDVNRASDFSQKVERYFEVKAGKVYGQLTTLSYNNDDNIAISRGTAYISIKNENAPENKEILSFKDYSASLEIDASGENVLVANIYDTVTNERQSVRDRLLFFNEVGAFGFNAVFTAISWQRLYAKHYVRFIQATQRERVIQFDAFINDLDFRNLQDNPLIYVDFLQSVFLVTEIDGFDSVNKCKLKCIKYN